MRPPHILSANFLTDLHAVFSTLSPSKLPRSLLEDDVNLHFLAERFKTWRTRTQARVKAGRSKLSGDDPLLCPVSLFRTMDFGRLETAHTRTLAWLLDKKEHGFGNRLLAALLGRLYLDGFKDLSVRRVVSEHPVDTTLAGAVGRLDVFAEGSWVAEGFPSEWSLVIEAKIDAWEGENQLDKYDRWLDEKARGRHVIRVFLTPDGRAAETGTHKWTALSYPQLVQVFRGVYGPLRGTPGFHFLRYYLAGVLQDICRWPGDLSEDAPDPYAVAAYLEGASRS